jgi:hypothetical protein
MTTTKSGKTLFFFIHPPPPPPNHSLFRTGLLTYVFKIRFCTSYLVYGNEDDEPALTLTTNTTYLKVIYFIFF